MGLEIERKFLLHDAEIISFLEKEGLKFKHLEILQFYIKITKNEEIRYRSEDGKFIKTIKIGKGLIREENECECDKKEFKEALKNRIGTLIQKDRYLFKLNNNSCNIDIFNAELNGLCTFEVEFKDEQTAVFYKLPEFFSNFIHSDVTCDARYKNKNLAICGDPNVNFSINNIFNVLENSDVELKFPPNMDSKEAFRVLFFKILNNIKKYKDEYLLTFDEEVLHQFRVNLRKNRSLLRMFSDIFDQKTTEIFSDKFKILANSTNLKRDFDVFLDFLSSQKNVDEIVYFISKANEKESEEIKKFLSDVKNYEFLDDWELFLKEESDFYNGPKAKLDLKTVASYHIRRELVAFERKIMALNEKSANEKFHKIRIELKRLRYAMEYFSNTLYVGNFKKYESRLKFMQELFGSLQDRDIWLEILDKMPPSQRVKKLQSKIYKQIYKLREEILQKRVKFVEKTCKISRKLKYYYI
ncbi:CYTH and CHAD domain-containing protein [Campylobacter sp. 7477a]|uniref:CYTH and CHAD domain-containing protein n=1 Tax=Campylobacter sp. 7477a TaxID=2735741 RepID=UPI003014F25B|nr:CHAD domain-containing protein [Campylobacter sp. 7477a]